MADRVEPSEELVYAVIGNIPPDYHSSDLRNYFSQFIEGKGFHCFHFRHRPERRKDENATGETTTATTSHSSQHGDDTKSQKKTKKTTCCVVHLKESKLKELIQMYHKKHWLDKKGESIASLCIISKITVSDWTGSQSHSRCVDSGEDSQTPVYKTRQEQRKIPAEREEFTAEDLHKLAELHPPDIMPNGNVGTPTLVFLEFIRQCRLPPVVIKKLGLSFPKTRTNKKYGSVPFNYGGVVVDDFSEDSEDTVVKTANGKEIHKEGEATVNEEKKSYGDISEKSRSKGKKAEKKRRKQMMSERIEEKMIDREKGDLSEEDNDSCEEWERHEALYDDPTNQERNKERLFEEEIELKWEKGGSGLVFYTDAQYWDAKEGDFDEKTADDWDVDMSVYYEPTGGDMDSRDFVKIRQEQRRRDGTEATDAQTVGIGRFERHTKGFGRRILTKQGWKDGEGLGSTITGMAEALENEGQNPKDRKGFGYRGEKLVRYAGTKRRAQKDVIISTIYDNPAETDPTEPLLRRHEHYGLKYREKIAFTKASQRDGDR